MTTPSATVRAQLDAIYDALPKVQCRGKCQSYCEDIDMSTAERERIRDATGLTIPKGRTGDHRQCPALGILGTCTVYEVRPLICRVWGAADGMRCPHGCEPDKRMTRAQVFHTFVDVMLASGDWLPAEAARIRALINDPQAERFAGEIMAGSREAAYNLYSYIRKSAVVVDELSPRYAVRARRGLQKVEARMGGPRGQR